VDAKTAVDAQVNLYDSLFKDPEPELNKQGFLSTLNPNSLDVLNNCKLEKSLETAKQGDSFQFMRLGYFCLDNAKSKSGSMVFNRSVSLKDSFKIN
jgi:glutaminyl-tRNA synthetase